MTCMIIYDIYIINFGYINDYMYVNDNAVNVDVSIITILNFLLINVTSHVA